MYNPSIKSQPSSSSTQLPQVLVQVQEVLVQVSEPLLNLEAPFILPPRRNSAFLCRATHRELAFIICRAIVLGLKTFLHQQASVVQ
jgi:hypothetical protein